MKPNELTVDNTWSIKLLVLFSINGRIINVDPPIDRDKFLCISHRHWCRVKNMLTMYLKYHKAGLTPTTPVTSIAISSVKMSIGRKSLTHLRSEMIFLQGKAEICRTWPTFALLPLRCPLSTKSEDYLSVWGCRW